MTGSVLITNDSNTYSVSIVIHNAACITSGVPYADFNLIPVTPKSVYQKSGNSSLSPQVAGSITAAPAGFFSRDPSDINVEGLIAYTVPGVDATTDSYNLVVYFAGIKTATGGYTTVGFVNTKTPIDEELLTQMSATPSTTYKTTASSRPMTVGGKSYTFQASVKGLVVGDYGYAVDVTFST